MSARPGTPPAIPTDWPTLPLSRADRSFMQLDWADTPDPTEPMPELTEVGWSYRVAPAKSAPELVPAAPWWARAAQAVRRWVTSSSA